ncbi:MAG: hypothetical protein JOY98_03945 [Candidatus Eremiobacteraeota bacterium]|nr:hypothetical protein [Candidatus Eremiobacteraeota bacterium]MBV8723499.1 hypothetical protein [Candidatus Eremiobacteraeota bacterium]
MSRLVRAALMVAALCVPLPGCAPNGPGPSGPWAASGTRLPREVRHIGGVIKASVYSIAPDEVQVVDSAVTIVASRSIYIHGVLETAHPGATFALVSPAVTIDGSIRAQTTGITRTDTPKGTDLIDACQLDIQGVYSHEVVAIAPGDDLDIVSNSDADSCTVAFHGRVTLEPGRTGNPEVAALRDGEPGGSVAIGTGGAIAFAKQALRKIGVTGDAYAPAIISCRTLQPLRAGFGGDGASDAKGTLVKAQSTWIFQATSGGKGGSAFVRASSIDTQGNRFEVLAGSGGNGGSVSDKSLTGSGVNGTARHPNAYSVSLFEGGGGDGGNAFVTAKGDASAVAGSGGNPGNVDSVAGSGYFDPPGNGGDITLHLGKAGTAGVEESSHGQRDGKYPYMYFSGGYGGTSQSATTASNGGNGATLFVEGPRDGKGVPADFKMRVDSFGNAGSGMSPCGSPGAKGGNGGNLLYSDGVERQNFDILSGFNGGTGGAGTPPGAGGSGGRDNDGKKIGSNGSQGATC